MAAGIAAALDGFAAIVGPRAATVRGRLDVDGRCYGAATWPDGNTARSSDPPA